jgi:hypothetical protein
VLGLGETSGFADHQTFSNCFHNCLRDLLKRVDFENPLHLGKETIQQSEVATRHPNDRRDRFKLPRLLGKSCREAPNFAPGVDESLRRPMAETQGQIQGFDRYDVFFFWLDCVRAKSKSFDRVIAQEESG